MFIFGNYQKLVENFGTFELEKSMKVPSTTISINCKAKKEKNGKTGHRNSFMHTVN